MIQRCCASAVRRSRRGAITECSRGCSPAQKNVDPPAMAKLCTSFARPGDARQLTMECAHGLGHGFTEAMAYDLSRALGACDAFGSGDLRGECHDGVFMENAVHGVGMKGMNVGDSAMAAHEHMAMNMGPAPSTDRFRKSDLAFPCDSVAVAVPAVVLVVSAARDRAAQRLRPRENAQGLLARAVERRVQLLPRVREAEPGVFRVEPAEGHRDVLGEAGAFEATASPAQSRRSSIETSAPPARSIFAGRFPPAPARNASNPSASESRRSSPTTRARSVNAPWRGCRSTWTRASTARADSLGGLSFYRSTGPPVHRFTSDPLRPTCDASFEKQWNRALVAPSEHHGERRRVDSEKNEDV